MSLSSSLVDQFRTYLSGTRSSKQPKRPADLIYAVDDVPPLFVLLLSGLQHVGLLAIFLIYPLLIIREAGVSESLTANILNLSMIALGVAAILQSLTRGPVGSGFLCPANHAAQYLAPSLMAVKLGGLPLLFGMTVFAGLLEATLSPILRRIRPLLPPELSGIVIFLVSITVGAVAVRYIAGVGAPKPSGYPEIAVAVITISTTVALNVWAKGGLRLFCALVGMLVGYLAAIPAGLLSPSDFTKLLALPLVAIPSFGHISWSFNAELALPFAIAAVVSTVKAVGVITVCQRINDASWVRPDIPSLSRGVLADGLGTAFSGLMGSTGLNSSTSCTGLAAATGVTSRTIGIAAGGTLIALTFLPILTWLLVLMPRPVMGASLLFAACFILVNGLQTISSRMLDTRRTLVIGLAISTGIAVEILPEIANSMPSVLGPLVGSSLVIGTITALLLHVIFRIGQRHRVTLTISPDATDVPAQIDDFFYASGKRWGARKDVMDRVSFGVNQAVEAVREHCEPQGPILVEAQFDEFNLDVQISYQGAPLELPDRRPSANEIMASEAGSRRLAGFILRRNADRVRSELSEGRATLHFNFDH